jgi:hypothetical protein
MSAVSTTKVPVPVSEHPLQYQWVLWENWRAKVSTSLLRYDESIFWQADYSPFYDVI